MTPIEPQSNSLIPFDINELLDKLEPGTLILTANQRLARSISQAYNHEQHRLGKTAWQPLTLYPLDDWLASQWRSLQLQNLGFNTDDEQLDEQPLQRLLSLREEIALWQQVIQQTPANPLQTSTSSSVARQVQQAYQLVLSWGLAEAKASNTSQDGLRLNNQFFQVDSLEIEAFTRWFSAFNRLCEEQQLVSSTQASMRVEEAFQAGKLNPYPHILLVGFDQLAPLHESIINAASNKLTLFQHRGLQASIKQNSYQDREHELWAAAEWTREQLLTAEKLTAEKQKTTFPKLGIVIPNLSQSRKEAARIFSAVLEPLYSLPSTPRYVAPFNISAEQALADTPIISAALDVLACNQPNPSMQQWLALFHSPFTKSKLAYQDEISIRNSGLPTISINKLLQLTPSINAEPASSELSIKTFADSLLGTNFSWHKQSLSAWLDLFTEQLKLVGWPGKRPLDSVEYQQLSHWQQCLVELKHQEHQPLFQDQANNQTLTGPQALSLLRQRLKDQAFQPQSSTSPVQILGQLEASGLHFDAIWLVGMNDQVLPASPNPNPFIPLSLQRDKGLPRSSATRELELAQQLLTSYRGNCHEVIASYSEWDQDQPLSPSPLITNWPESEHNKPSANHPLLAAQIPGKDLISFDDDIAPSLGEHEQLRGGSGILKDQSACPFRAYANHRLNLRPLLDPEPFNLSLLRGLCLHDALEAFWSEVKTLDQLKALTEDVLLELIEATAEQSIASLKQQRPDIYQPEFTRLEQRRLVRLLQNWLAIEKERQPFEVIATEKSMETALGRLPIRLRIDRIDQQADGQWVLIDYKTGNSQVSDWAGERIKEPQLPLYSLSIEQQARSDVQISALAFAQVQLKDATFKGVGEPDSADPLLLSRRPAELPEAWPDTLAHWQRSLTALAESFVQGDARVAPYFTDSCRYCDLHTLCRINEQVS